MVTSGLIFVFAGFVKWIVDGLPDTGLPDWMTASTGAVGQVFAFADSMSVWFPTPLVFSIVGTLLAINLISFGIKIARMVLSLFTAGGGSAA